MTKLSIEKFKPINFNQFDEIKLMYQCNYNRALEVDYKNMIWRYLKVIAI